MFPYKKLLCILWGVLFLGFIPGRGKSENLLQHVRFGRHEGFSRVVFDLREKTTYRILTEQPDRTIVVEFASLSLLPTAQIFKPRDPLIQQVRLFGTPTQTRGEIELKQPGRVKTHFQMDAPPRIVIDLMRDGVSTSASKLIATEEISQPAASSVSLPKEKEVAPVVSGTPNDPPSLSTNQSNIAKKLIEGKPPTTAGEKPARITPENQPQKATDHLTALRAADTLLEQQHYREALAAYAAIVEKYPGSEGAVLSQMRMAELGIEFPNLLPEKKEKRYEPYYQPLETLIQLSKTYPLSPLAGVALFKAGMVLFQRQEFHAALEKFHQVLAQYKERELQQEATEKLAQTVERLLLSHQEPGKLLELLQTFFRERERIQVTTAYPDLLFAVAESYAQLGLLEEAQSILQSLLTTAPDPQQRKKAALKQATLLFQSGQITEAKRLLTPVNQFTEAWNRGKALLMLGEIALQEQYPQEALDYLTKETALFTAPAEQTTLFYLQGKSYQMLGEDAKGLKAFQRCTEISGEAKDSALSAIREQCFFQVGDILMRQHQYPEALSLYQKILQAFPQSTRREWTLLQIAQIYRHLSDEQGVITTLTTLRASTNSPFWQLVATEHLHDFQWQKQFDPRLAEFQNSLLQ